MAEDRTQYIGEHIYNNSHRRRQGKRIQPRFVRFVNYRLNQTHGSQRADRTRAQGHRINTAHKHHYQEACNNREKQHFHPPRYSQTSAGGKRASQRK